MGGGWGGLKLVQGDGTMDWYTEMIMWYINLVHQVHPVGTCRYIQVVHMICKCSQSNKKGVQPGWVGLKELIQASQVLTLCNPALRREDLGHDPNQITYVKRTHVRREQMQEVDHNFLPIDPLHFLSYYFSFQTE